MAFDPRRLGESHRQQADRIERTISADPGKATSIENAKRCAASFARRGREQARKDFMDDNGIAEKPQPAGYEYWG